MNWSADFRMSVAQGGRAEHRRRRALEHLPPSDQPFHGVLHHRGALHPQSRGNLNPLDESASEPAPCGEEYTNYTHGARAIARNHCGR